MLATMTHKHAEHALQIADFKLWRCFHLTAMDIPSVSRSGLVNRFVSFKKLLGVNMTRSSGSFRSMVSGLEF